MSDRQEHTHIIAKASKARASVAIVFPLAAAFVLSLALTENGGQLTTSNFPSANVGVGFMAIVTWMAVYSVPAFAALRAPTYLFSTATQLVMPSAEKLDLAKIKAISVQKTIWHKLLVIQASEGTRKVVVTFARGSADDIRAALRNDENLRSRVTG